MPLPCRLVASPVAGRRLRLRLADAGLLKTSAIVCKIVIKRSAQRCCVQWVEIGVVSWS